MGFKFVVINSWNCSPQINGTFNCLNLTGVMRILSGQYNPSTAWAAVEDVRTNLLCIVEGSYYYLVVEVAEPENG